jgi:hypothetical protein
LISPDLKKLTLPFARTSNIIWFAFIFAPVIYGFLAWLVTDGGSRQMGEGELPGEVIYLAVLLSAFSGIVLPWVIAPRFFGPRQMLSNSSTPPVSFDGEAERIFERLGERDRERARHHGAIQSFRIVRWAGAESVAIYGLLALFLGVTDVYGAWGFGLAAVVLLILLRPDYERDLEAL